MNVITIILLGIIIGGMIAGVILLWSRKNIQNKTAEGQALLLLQNQLQDVIRQIQDFGKIVDEKLGESTRLFQNQFGQSTQIVKEVTEKLTKLDETNKQVINFADQLRKLEDTLTNPKQRGVLGEYYLETVLKNVLPPGSYQTQYQFKDGSLVDAAIFVRDKIIPIDSKFSLENYNRIIESSDESEKKKLEEMFRNDLKNRIDETSKYIKPEEGTMDFVLCLFPLRRFIMIY